jgi:hypothetical protein
MHRCIHGGQSTTYTHSVCYMGLAPTLSLPISTSCSSSWASFWRVTCRKEGRWGVGKHPKGPNCAAGQPKPALNCAAGQPKPALNCNGHVQAYKLHCNNATSWVSASTPHLCHLGCYTLHVHLGCGAALGDESIQAPHLQVQKGQARQSFPCCCHTQCARLTLTRPFIISGQGPHTGPACNPAAGSGKPPHPHLCLKQCQGGVGL